MGEKLQRGFQITVTALLIFQLTGCGTLLYPERRGQMAGHLDAGVVILDTVGLLFFIIPGVIAFAVDFSNGTIYLPARPAVVSKADLRQIKFNPKDTSLAQIERIIKEKTGYALNLKRDNVRISRLKSANDMLVQFAKAERSTGDCQLALNR